MKKGHACRQAGFTLLELVITMGLVSVVGLLLVVIIVNSTGVFYKESSKLSQGLNSNDALSSIRGDIKQSNGVVATYTDGSTTYTSGTTQLILKLSSIDSSNNLISNTYAYFVYFLDQKKLRLKSFPDPASVRKKQDQIFSTIVDSVLFQYFNLSNPPLEVSPTTASKVKITITLKEKSGAGYETRTATSEATLRND